MLAVVYRKKFKKNLDLMIYEIEADTLYPERTG
jgi:hypothetical protein